MADYQTPEFHPAFEEYCEAIFELREDDVDVIQARIADRLMVSRPAVSEMIKRLESDGLVAIDHNAITLTTDGDRLAQRVVRRHRLAERFLTDILGLSWADAHKEAGKWEHVISTPVEQAIVRVLGDPTTCPHGNPIPGTAMPDRELQPLTDVVAGDHIRLERVTEQVEIDLDTLTWLDTNGFRPGADADVKGRGPDGTLTLDVGGITIALGPALAEQLFVSVG
jgi:DtxR family transcriptional regulator, Mn-dependent transcriptional regulator